MRGPSQIRALLADWLELEVPKRLPYFRELWDLAEDELPAPVRYDPHEPLVLDDYPVLSVVTGRHTTTPLADLDDIGQALWRTEYPVRLFAWVHAEGEKRTFDLRDDYLTMLQTLAASSRTFAGFGGGNLTMVPPLTADFSGLDPADGDHFIAGGYVGFTVRATETLSSRVAHPGSPQGLTVSAVDVTGGVLPTPPAVAAPRATDLPAMPIYPRRAT